MGYVPEGFTFDSFDIKAGWVAIDNNEWIPANACRPTGQQDTGIWYTIRGDRKPEGYKPEGINYGSFDIVWLLDEKPTNVVNKPSGFKLTTDQVKYLKHLNREEFGWLVNQGDTTRVLTMDEDGEYRCPVPCMSGNNQVKVLEWEGQFARIETVSIYKPIPKLLHPWLCHKWWAFRGDRYYMPFATGGVKYPLFAKGDSAWVQGNGLISVTEHLLK